MTRAETLSLGVSGALALASISGYLLDRFGVGISPPAIVLLSIAGTIGLVAASDRRKDPGAADVAIWIGLVALVFAAIVRLGWPTLLPPGRGPDLTHHLLLVDYIEQHGQLVHDRSLDGAMGEMAHYTPGAHLLAAIAGALFGVDGLRAFFPLLVAAAALTAGFIYLIARRLRLAVPYAITAVLLLFLPVQYFYGAFTHDGFLAQSIATLFAVAAWWALVVWDEQRTAVTALVFSIFLAAVFLSWPVFLGPLIVLWSAFAMATTGRTRETVKNLVVGFAPMAVLAAIHMTGRLGWLTLVRTSGAVMQPSWDTVGWLLPLLALLGIYTSVSSRRARTTIVLLFAIALQAITLFVMAKTQGADTPYMALKMAYLAIYPMAILGAMGVSIVRRVFGERDAPLAWAIATLLVVIAVRPALTAPRAVPVVSLDLYAAGKWTRAHVGPACVDYLVGDAETAYWLHLAVLGNPRASARMREMDVYDPRAAIGTWITAEGRGYAIADLRLLPDEVRRGVEIVEAFGSAAVIKRPGAMMGDCDLGR